jgi:hypothetical protein
MASNFVHLRLHTEYSLIDGVVRIKPLVKAAAAAGMPAIDAFAMGLAMRHLACADAYRQMIEEAAPGATYVSLHCSTPGEVERLHPQDAEWRIAEYQLFDDPEFLDWVARQDVELVGFRRIRDLYREQSPPERPGAA